MQKLRKTLTRSRRKNLSQGAASVQSYDSSVLSSELTLMNPRQSRNFKKENDVNLFRLLNEKHQEEFNEQTKARKSRRRKKKVVENIEEEEEDNYSDERQDGRRRSTIENELAEEDEEEGEENAAEYGTDSPFAQVSNQVEKAVELVVSKAKKAFEAIESEFEEYQKPKDNEAIEEEFEEYKNPHDSEEYREYMKAKNKQATDYVKETTPSDDEV